MKNNTCCSADCPKTDYRIIRELCEFWYPYGSKKRCQALLDKLIETNDSVRKAHQEYLERGKNDSIN